MLMDDDNEVVIGEAMSWSGALLAAMQPLWRHQTELAVAALETRVDAQ